MTEPGFPFNLDKITDDLLLTREEQAVSFACLDCETDTNEIHEYYMVENAVWESVAGVDDGDLCIECLEKRLGRKLTPGDFSDAPINTEAGWKKSDRLMNRLGWVTLGWVTIEPPLTNE